MSESEFQAWLRLEELLDKDTSAQQDIAKKYPNEMVRWVILQKRNGKHCPMSRGILKIIAYNERNNPDFQRNLEERKWKQIY